jgi:hypothetical protein
MMEASGAITFIQAIHAGGLAKAQTKVTNPQRWSNFVVGRANFVANGLPFAPPDCHNDRVIIISGSQPWATNLVDAVLTR